MAKINLHSLNYRALNTEIVGIFATFCVLFGLVFTILGIKLKWFKHRMNFEPTDQIPVQNNNRNNGTNTDVTEQYRSTSRYSQTLHVQGVFRKLQDDEILIERPKSLPPVRVKSKSESVNYSAQNQVEKLNKNVPTTTKNKQRTPSPKKHAASSSPKKPHERSKTSPQRKGNVETKINQPTTSQQNGLPRKDRPKSPKKVPNQTGKNQGITTKIQKVKNSPKEVRNLELDIEDRKEVRFVREYEEIHCPDDTEHDGTRIGIKETATRRATGYTPPSREQIEELQSLRLEDEKTYPEIVTDDYPGTLRDENGRVVFKLEGLSDDDEEIKNLKPFKFPVPEPRVTVEKSIEQQQRSSEEELITSPFAVNANATEDHNNDLDDIWSAVRQQRNLTMEMAKHHQAIREAAQLKAAKRQLLNPSAYDLNEQQERQQLESKTHPHFEKLSEKQKRLKNVRHEDDSSTEA